ncbi:hypothetical protein PGT21_013309 [Puccinia graminis f. sp. tritici]|uniref:Uncharacterized protein n=1 Tax=Puccinia graminis f. sp. tritici TaxID=56615 RepID=A0A5B0QXB6_PUCGR|nr:hypothetical protein PGT21_013309 [Puccinia graminis f. sp. tritici]
MYPAHLRVGLDPPTGLHRSVNQKSPQNGGHADGTLDRELQSSTLNGPQTSANSGHLNVLRLLSPVLGPCLGHHVSAERAVLESRQALNPMNVGLYTGGRSLLPFLELNHHLPSLLSVARTHHPRCLRPTISHLWRQLSYRKLHRQLQPLGHQSALVQRPVQESFLPNILGRSEPRATMLKLPLARNEQDLELNNASSKGRREWGRPSSTQQEDHLVNFVPVLPDHSQKRKNQQADLHVKRRRTGTDDPRPQATSRPSRINRVRQNSYAVRPAFLDSNQLDPHESDLEHQLPESPQSNRSSSALRRFSFRSQPVDEESDSQESNGLPSASRPLPSRSQPVDHEPDALRPWFGQTNGSSHITLLLARIGKKRRATPVAPRIPTSAQVHRRRQRQARVRPGSLRVTPSFRDDDVIVPTYHPAASGVESWRSSLPRDLSCPPEPTTSSPSEPPTPPRRRQAGPVTGCCAGQQLVSQLTEATGLLTVCLERVGLSAQGPQISTTTRPSGTHRNLSLLHMKTLFGKCMELNQFPPPATEQEKANWKDYDQDNDSEDDSDDESVEASAATLSIMWRCMRKAGVVSFRPDFTRRHRDPDNMFLWDLAHHIFIKLVRAQHYSEIDLESSTEASIRQAILNHTRHLRRTYHEAGWDARRLDSRAVLKRRQARTNRLRDNRVKFLGTQAALVPLISVATECTSDAETEANDGRQKRVAVKHLPWRHPRIGRAFKMTQDQHQIMSNIPSIRCLL